MNFQTRNDKQTDSLRSAAREARAHRLEGRGERPVATSLKAFADWGELKAYLVHAYGLEDVVIQLRPDYVNAEVIDSMDRVEVREISSSEVLLSLSVGLRVSLDVHLFRAAEVTAEGIDWPPRSQYEAILMCAKGVFSRTVRDRVVDLMSARGNSEVVSFFLDKEGRVESSSSKAREFCDKHFPASKRVDDFFPLSHWDYLQGAIRLRETSKTLSYRNESLVFCFHQDSGIVDCLLQKMGDNGYLLSLAMDR
ncbi:hypothetical protein IEN85_23095 [Pelagicoccus sp. NFK12]|uniref:Uncharacterized protein n=1 Tax=Pelagicoccus enzymogenes TaxID=2773457 RepID=A0A927FEV3_9BACT|nr:hypothetical protein [Pelagicoccus enzymogenes]MBD5782405.1 hypothetical protein [Pelagicoccus enzymogenes]